MNKKEICVVIPIYKEILNSFEIQSVKQCVKVLSDYTIHFVCPQGLNIDFYKENFLRIENFTFFDNNYFKDITGYNRLMLSAHFYEKFDNYQYMLIHQTDCYVFKDELIEWATKEYDYIGGVWFENYEGNPKNGSKLWLPGNGGLSLRKVKSFAKVLSSNRPVKDMKEVFLDLLKRKNIGRINFLKGLFLFPLHCLGYRNTVKSFASNYQFNEDSFFVEISCRFKLLKIPPVAEAIGFSWDRHPNYLYSLTNTLPFACHGWFREDFIYEENKQFWLQHISI